MDAAFSATTTAAAAAAVRLPPADAWVSEVLQGCARVKHTPHKDLLHVLAPVASSAASTATPSPSRLVGKVAAARSSVVGVDAEEDVDVLTPPYSPDSPDAQANATPGAYQPYLSRVERTAPTAEAEALRAALPARLLRKAYRVQLPCVTSHTTKAERLLNCAASPRCMSGLRTLGVDAATREDCLRAAMGEGPAVVSVPPLSGGAERIGDQRALKEVVSPPSSLHNTKTAAAALKSARAPALANNASGDVRTISDDMLDASTSAAAANALTPTRTVEGDPTFPCLWRGVRNLMNTCYFSSVLQMVFSVAGLRRAILNDCAAAAADELDSKDIATATAAVTPADTQLAESGLKELFALMAFSRDGAGADPKSFASYLSLDVKVQQDAQEFFTLLLDWLRCHCGSAVQAAVTSTFSGTLLYDRRCGACGRSAKRAEPFLYLSLPVRSTLEDSLSEFSKPEEVDGFMCEGCGQTVVATSRQYMRTLPEVLVVHWNRFEFDLQTLQRHKVTTATSFPLQMDMAAYTRQWHEQKRHTATAAYAPASASTAKDEAEEASQLYELRGIVNHHGDTALSGHYTYHGKVSPPPAAGGSPSSPESRSSGSTWLNFNDAEVTPLNRYHGQRGLSADAYLLVYHRVCSPTTSAATTAVATSTSDSPSTTAPSTAAADVPTSAAPSPAEYPRYLRQYVDQVNQRCLDERQAWLDQRAQVSSLYDLWAATAQSVFDTPTSTWTAATSAGSSAASSSSYAVPTVWLQQLGRLFLPAYMDVAAFGGGAESQLKRKKKDAASVGGDGGVTGSETDKTNGFPSHPIGTAGSSHAFGGEEGSPLSEESPVDGVVVAAAAAGPRRHGYIRSVEEVYQLIRQHSLLQALPLLCCPHGSLAPWGAYKLVSAAAFAKISHFLAICGAPLKAVGQADAGGGVVDAQGTCAFVDGNLCPLCVAAMAAVVQDLAVSSVEDEQAELALTHAWQEAERKKDAEEGSLSGVAVSAGHKDSMAQSTDLGDEESDGQVLVSETVVEGWASFYVGQRTWSRVQQTEGYTAVVVMREARLTPPRAPATSTSAHASSSNSCSGATSPLSLTAPDATISSTLADAEDAVGIAALNVDKGDLDLSAQLLCPHGALRPGQHTLAIPASLRRYWIRRFTEIITVAQRSGQLRVSDPAWRVTEEDIGYFLLPCIPASTASTTCLECMRTSVQTLTSRHHQRLLKMEERKRFPSLWLAGAMTSPAGVAQLLLATGAENEEQLLAAQHPNRLFYKHNAEREYRDYAKRWTEAQQARIAHQEAEVARLQLTVTKKKEHDAAWNARVTSRRGGRGGGGGAASRAGGASNSCSSGTDLAAAPATAASPDPATLEGRLFYAEETLAKLRAQPVPDYDVAYGCVPTWWVARWYAMMQDDAPNTSPSPDAQDGTNKSDDAEDAAEKLPPITFQIFKCEHGGCLLDVPWLNPSDGFWQGVRGKRAEVLWNGVRVERATTGQREAASSTSCNGPGKEDYRNQCWLPPLVILPMEEYLALLAQYGAPHMLARALGNEESIAGGKTAEKSTAATAPTAPAMTDADTVEDVPAAAATDAAVAPSPQSPLSPVTEAVIQIVTHNGVRQLQPAPCPGCCAKLLANFEVNGESFVNGSLKLNFHIKKSRKNFYDASSVLTSAAVQQSSKTGEKSLTASAAAPPPKSGEDTSIAPGSHPGAPIAVSDGDEGSCSVDMAKASTDAAKKDDDTIPDGIHYYTTLAQLRGYISSHLREKHGYLVQPADLQIARGKNKPLKLRGPQPPLESGKPGEGEAALDRASLQDLGIRDGDTLSVQSVDAIAQVCATAPGGDEEWEAIPPELLQAGGGYAGPNSSAGVAATAAREHAAAFRETRLQGSHVGGSGAGATAGAAAAAAQMSTAGAAVAGTVVAGSTAGTSATRSEDQPVACAVCTFLNAPGMVVCEMCEAPLPPR